MATDVFRTAAATLYVSASISAAAAVALPSAAEGNTVRFVNEGPNRCYVAVGASGVVATTPSTVAANTCIPILAGTDVVFQLGPNDTFFSHVTLTGETARLIVSVSKGE